MLVGILYNLFIYPIELLIDFVFTAVYRLLHNPGFAIIAVSVIVNLLILPLYKKADALQEEERKQQKIMAS